MIYVNENLSPRKDVRPFMLDMGNEKNLEDLIKKELDFEESEDIKNPLLEKEIIKRFFKKGLDKFNVRLSRDGMNGIRKWCCERPGNWFLECWICIGGRYTSYQNGYAYYIYPSLGHLRGFLPLMGNPYGNDDEIMRLVMESLNITREEFYELDYNELFPLVMPDFDLCRADFMSRAILY